jgi:uncharacterized protein
VTQSSEIGDLLRGQAPDAVWAGRVIDSDVHVVVPGLEVLQPYLGEHWMEFVRDRGFLDAGLGRAAMVGNTRTYPPGSPTTARDVFRPPDERQPASELRFLQDHVLDPWRAEYAVITCNSGVDFIRHPDFAKALASAINDWLIDEWLSRDPRLVASLVVPSRSIADMVEEIERVGDHPGFVAVYMPVRSDRPYGNRHWHPVFKAMTDKDLVMNMHWGGTTEGPPTPVGWPQWYVEEYAVEVQLYMAQLTSMLSEGTFAAFPGLRVTIAEIGFAWVPSLWWRLQKEWKGLRRDTPWMNEPVIDTVRRQIRFTTAPTDAGPPEELARVIEWLGSEELLMFGTDYPHAHDDDLAGLLAAMPESMAPKVMAGNAADWYRL